MKTDVLLAVDVHYDNDEAIAAGVAFDHWSDSDEKASYLSKIKGIDNYVPGQFYRRELPCLLRLLNGYGLKPACIVIDGYVYLDGHAKPGLGKYLYDALNGEVTVIGVAKKPFAGIDERCKIFRGVSHRPLFVTSAGIDLAAAKARIMSMHGAYRIPTLLKQADRLCRQPG